MLNKDGYNEGKTSILIAGDKFGCRLSREHAPLSINDMGIWCTTSTSFTDILYSNCFNNVMLPIILPQNKVGAFLEDASVTVTELTINHTNQRVIRPAGESYFVFNINLFYKGCLLDGLDNIGLTLEKVEII